MSWKGQGIMFLFLFKSRKSFIITLLLCLSILLSCVICIFIANHQNTHFIEQAQSNVYNGSSFDTQTDTESTQDLTFKGTVDGMMGITESDDYEDVLLRASHGIIIESEYPNISTYTDGNSWGFPKYLPNDWKEGLKIAEAGFTYTTINTGAGGTFHNAKASIQTFNTATNIQVAPFYVTNALGQSVSFTKCLTGSKDDAPAAVDDSNHGPYPLDEDNGPNKVPTLRFYIQSIDTVNHRVYIRIQTPYIAYDSRKTSVQAIGGGVFFDYSIPSEEPKYSYVTIQKHGFTSHADNNWSLYGFAGIKYGVYRKADNQLVDYFTLDDTGRPTPETIKLIAEEDYYLKEVSTVKDNKYYKASSEICEFHSGKSDTYTQLSPYLIHLCDEIRFGKFFAVKEAADSSIKELNNLYSISNAKYYLCDEGGNHAYFIAGFHKELVSGTNLSYQKPIIKKVNKLTTNSKGYLTITISYDGNESDITNYYNNVQKDGNTYTITFTKESPMLLPIGKYHLSEYDAPNGYKLDSSCNDKKGKSHGIHITNTTDIQSVTCKEEPLISQVDLNIIKKSTNDKSIVLQNALFEICYYNAYYNLSQINNQKPYRKWYFKTDANGSISFASSKSFSDNTHSTDKFFKLSDGSRYLPLGTITVKEIAAPKGYLSMEEDTNPANILVDGKAQTNKNCLLFQIKESNASNSNTSIWLNDSEITDGNNSSGIQIEYFNSMIRSDLSFSKKKYPDNAPMPNIAFRLQSKTTGEEHIIVTDNTGYATTSLQSDNINSNDKYLNALTDEEVYTNHLQPSGIWFYGTNDQSKWMESNIDRSAGALPPDTYILNEIPSIGNDGTRLIENKEIVIAANQSNENEVLEILDVPTPQIQTQSKDKVLGGNLSIPQKNCTICDEINYQYLDYDTTYTIKGYLVTRKEFKTKDGKIYKAGEAIKDDKGNYIASSVTFTTSQNQDSLPEHTASGSTKLEYNFDASTLQYAKGVWYTYLCSGDNKEQLLNTNGTVDYERNNVIGYYNVKDNKMHYVEDTDLLNTNEWVNFISLETDAWTSDTFTNVSCVDDNTHITDTVTLYGLVEKNTYSLTATLYDSETESIIKDWNGKPLQVTKTFTYKEDSDSKSMKVDVAFPKLDTNAYAGKHIVIFQTLYDDKKVLLEACDASDIRETIYFPKLQTYSTGENGSKNIAANDKLYIKDIISYEGLAPKKDYTVYGTLHYLDDAGVEHTLQKKDGTPVSASKTITPTRENGTFELIFTCNKDEIDLQNIHKLVAFEELYFDNKLVGKHTDIQSEDQSVYIPSIKTKLRETKTNSQFLNTFNKKISLIDSIQYDNLIPGEQYFLLGKLMNKQSGKMLKNDDKEITSITSFIPTQSNGTVYVKFEFDGAKIKELQQGTNPSLVAYEYLYSTHNNINLVIAQHTDIEDVEQTIVTVSGKTSLSDDTGKKDPLSFDKQVKLIDKVSYHNLIVGKKYTVTGKLYKDISDATKLEKEYVVTDHNGRKCVPVLDRNGNPVTGSNSFIADKSDGEVTVSFTFHPEILGKTEKNIKVVAFEEMTVNSEKNHIIFSHKDINDKEQTITFIKTIVKDKIKPQDTPREPEKETTHSEVKTGDTIMKIALLLLISLTIFECTLIIRKKRKGE